VHASNKGGSLRIGLNTTARVMGLLETFLYVLSNAGNAINPLFLFAFAHQSLPCSASAYPQ
jgi:hypothetical protein